MLGRPRRRGIVRGHRRWAIVLVAEEDAARLLWLGILKCGGGRPRRVISLRIASGYVQVRATARCRWDVIGGITVLHALHAGLEAGREVCGVVVYIWGVAAVVVGAIGVLSWVVQRGYSDTCSCCQWVGILSGRDENVPGPKLAPSGTYVAEVRGSRGCCCCCCGGRIDGGGGRGV